MRLLTLRDDGEIGVVEFLGSDIPPYAVLSHTWGNDDEEVTFKDLVEGTGKRKAGYRKITFCEKRAAHDNLQYFWVDTCCIDKSSSAELSEAINSMFRWYNNAVKCYVFLADISSSTLGLSFQESRWFTRGWTLQELVAPKLVEFYSIEGELLGDKISFMQEIARITGISIQALEGGPLSQFAIDERMSWAEKRQTKREEDKAYSLLGIFDIHMPLIYGEGRDKALIRLQKEIEESLRDRLSVSSLALNDKTTGPTVELQTQHMPFNKWHNFAHEHRVATAQQKLLDSLRFPQSQERKHQIHEAHQETYQWILQSALHGNQHWDSLTSWLSSTESRRIYWIHGKPGSGKSTMMRFLDQNIIIPDHMLPWSEDKMVLKAHYFFWNPGTSLQKSLKGLLQTVLLQLLEKQPHLIPQAVHQRKWNTALTSGNQIIEWTDSDLQHALNEYILHSRRTAKVFLLLDGLDELDGSDDAREELINLITNLATLENVKICLSSRPWNIFRDAFMEFPQLKLEDLTREDISKYVEAQLHGQIRFQNLLRYDHLEANHLISTIIRKAAGVFLWVRLVVRELVQGLRDGDGIHALQQKIEEIPSDLNDYFKRLMNSISPRQLRKASALLQIALYQEKDYSTGHPLRLIDLSFVDEGDPNFALTGQYHFRYLDFSDSARLHFLLDSTFRQLNSCCMGLLECKADGGEINEDGYSLSTSGVEGDLRNDPSIRLQDVPRPELLDAFLPTVHFIHRSCRDFLLTPSIQSLLHENTHGPYDVRMYLLSSRLSQFVAFQSAGTGERHAMAIASNVLTALSLPVFKHTPICEIVATIMKPTIESIMRTHDFPNDFWYIDPIISSWHSEDSSFLTLAIDFGLSSYVTTHLTSEYIRMKRGRPVLDYILRPRFPTSVTGDGRRLSLEILVMALRLGADPNEMYESVSVWALFLCFVADFFLDFVEGFRESGYYGEFSTALELLIRAGAAPLLPLSSLSQSNFYVQYSGDDYPADMTPEQRFRYRWSTATPAVEPNSVFSSEPLYAVVDLINEFRPYLGPNTRLRALLDGR